MSSEKNRLDQLSTAQTLSEALPYMRKYAGATIVIKYGGNAMGESDLSDSFAHDIVLMKQVGMNPVIVSTNAMQSVTTSPVGDVTRSGYSAATPEIWRATNFV